MQIIGQETPSSTEPHNLPPHTVNLVQSSMGEGRSIVYRTSQYHELRVRHMRYSMLVMLCLEYRYIELVLVHEYRYGIDDVIELVSSTWK